MQIDKLLTILRNPIGIESSVLKAARLEAANMIEAQSMLEDPITCTQACLSDDTPTYVHAQDCSTTFNIDNFQSAPKNHIEEGKPAMAELPLDLLTDLLCPAYAEGCLKYARNSWRRGFKMSVMFSACLRHLTAFYYHHETYDQETLTTYKIKKHHLGAAIFCIISIYNDWKNFTHNDDRPKP